jgi:hypothetical protein
MAVRAVVSTLVHVRVHVEAARHREPADDKAEGDQEAAADEFASLLEPHWNLPAEKQHQSRAQCEQHGVPDGKSQREAERARITRRTERRGERQRGDGHEVIGAETVKKPESEHRTGEHGGDYRWLSAVGLRPWARPKAYSLRSRAQHRLAHFISIDIYSCM